MNTRVLADRIAEESPCPSARITGLVYLLYFLAAVSGVERQSVPVIFCENLLPIFPTSIPGRCSFLCPSGRPSADCCWRRRLTSASTFACLSPAE